MKKSAIILGGVLGVAALGGGYFALTQGGAGGSVTKMYWDGKSEINQLGQDGSLALVKAVEAKDLAAVAQLIAQGADVDKEDKNGKSSLLKAVELGDRAILETVLLATHADLKDPKYLKTAIEKNDAGVVEALLNKGADVEAVLEFVGRKRPDDVLDYKDERVTTPLKKAVREEKPEVAEVLAKHGAKGIDELLGEHVRTASPQMVMNLAKYTDLNKVSVKGMDLLTYAAGEANAEVTSYLLNENVGDLNKALVRVLTQKRKDKLYEDTVEMFVKAGARPSVDVLEMMLKRKNTAMFTKLAGCYRNAEVIPQLNEEDVFVYALRAGQIEIVRWLIEHGADIWKVGKNGMTPLRIAASFAKDRPEIMELFEAQIKEVDDLGYNGETLLMIYAQSGDFDNFQRIVNKGGNIWLKDNNGKTLLMYAAEGGNIKILDYLIFKGDNLAATDKQGKTPLMYAAEKGQAKAAKYLADKGVSISAADENGKVAAMYAAEKGYHEIVEMLINMGESAATTDKNDKTLLMYAAEGGNLKAVETLLLKGVDVNARDKNGKPVLSYAAEGNNDDIAYMLLRKGANVFAVADDGYAPMMYALLKGNAKMYKMIAPGNTGALLQAKSDNKSVGIMAVEGGNNQLIEETLKTARSVIDVQDNQGRTFLMMLAAKGRPEVLRQGLQWGNLQLKDNEGRTALMYAAEKSVGVNLMGVIKALSKESINTVDNEGRTALMYAVGYEDNQPVKMHMLLTNGADAKIADKKGRTALMYALDNPYSDVSIKSIEELLERGRNVDRKDIDGRSALMFAVKNKNVAGDTVRTLINRGAKVNDADKNGKTVLMYAAEGGDIGKIRLLLKAGAKADVQTKDGKTVKDFINQDLTCFKAAAEALL